MGYELNGKVWDRRSFREYVSTLPNLPWVKAICVHHTSSPNLAQRPEGWKIQHLRNLQHYYQNELHWSAGPHLFTDEDQIFGLSSLYQRGVHAVSFNATAIGIETLGDYDHEDPLTGRGLQCWQTTAAAVAILLHHLDLAVNEETVLFHRDDPRTTKTCPGVKVRKDWFLSLVRSHAQDRADPADITTPAPLNLRQDLGELCRRHGIT
jgi:hypothetical protein